MWLVDFLFGVKKRDVQQQTTREPDVVPRLAPGTQISYNIDLIPQLRAEHQQLLKLFAMINKAFAGNDLVLTAKYLEDFRRGIQSHLLTENIRFYIYLEHSLGQDTESLGLMRDFRQEMDTIGKAVLTFLGKYKDIATRPDFSIPFAKDLEDVGKVLVDRIKREEETLYPLYFPVY